jgi:hypothetical protein
MRQFLPGVTEDEKLENCVIVHALRLHYKNTPELKQLVKGEFHEL